MFLAEHVMSSTNVTVRAAARDDLAAINRVIEAAVMTWQLPDRVKRLAMPGYRYNEVDFVHLQMVVAENQLGQVAGVAAWEPAEPGDAPAGYSALLLHGLFVDPAYQRLGFGRQLLQAAESAVRQQRVDGLLVRAQQDASGFFQAMGMQQLPVDNPDRQYANRYWKQIY